MWIAKIKDEPGEFEAETREQLITQLVDKYADEDYEFKAPDIEALREENEADEHGLIGVCTYFPASKEWPQFLAQLDMALEQAREDYYNNDPDEHRTYPL